MQGSELSLPLRKPRKSELLLLCCLCCDCLAHTVAQMDARVAQGGYEC